MTVLCDRCQLPKTRGELILGPRRWDHETHRALGDPTRICRGCAYPAGGAPGEDDEDDRRA
jgi:hypothetical protein